MSKIFDAVRRASENRALNVGPTAARMGAIDLPDRQGDLNTTERLADTLKADPVSPSVQSPQQAPPQARPLVQDRRKQRRASVSLSVRLRYADPQRGGFDDVLRTANSGRSSLYFTTNKKRYHQGMRLGIVYPYYPAENSIPASEDPAEVVRVDHLPDGRFGVAVLLQQRSQLEGSAAGAMPIRRVREAAERRGGTRNPFSASAIVVETRSGVRLYARCSDLSVTGCYVDTINPFPEGARVRLRLSFGQQNFETGALVRSSHAGMGMGIGFYELAPEQELLLIEWMNGGATEPFPIQEQPAVRENVDSPTVDLASRLIRMLRSKNLLTQAEASVLFSKEIKGDDELVCRPCADRL